MTSAMEIYQDLTDRATNALWARDYDTVLGLLALPYRIATQDFDLLHESEADLRDALVHYRDFLEHSGAQDFHRIATRAAFAPETPDRIEGEHESYVLRGGQYVVDRYVSTQVLLRDKGVWRGVENRSRVRNANCTLLSPDILRRLAEREHREKAAG
ncbi:MAG: hypothetical protein EP318_02035 [Rhodobacteraceae bacterium]|nr:MAG: hypothetical protein EP318_02035 [Paracoccaceae bacterium]